MEALLNDDASIKLDIFAYSLKTCELLETATGTLIEDLVMGVVAAINEYILLFAVEFGADWESRLSPTERSKIPLTPPSAQIRIHLDHLGKTLPFRKEKLRMIPGFPDPQVMSVPGMGGKLCQKMGAGEEPNLLAYLVPLYMFNFIPGLQFLQNRIDKLRDTLIWKTLQK